jgi:hypothetical protein
VVIPVPTHIFPKMTKETPLNSTYNAFFVGNVKAEGVDRV